MKPWSQSIRNKVAWLVAVIAIGLTIAAMAFTNDEAAPSMDFAQHMIALSNVPPPAEPVEKPKHIPLSDHIVEYHISVKYDEQHKTLQGDQTVTWRNPGTKPVSELYFHLYQNAFKSDKSTFMRESGGMLRGVKLPKGAGAFMEITSMKTLDGSELLHRMKYVQPDDGNENDQTLVKVKLLNPVEPNGKVTLRMQFYAQLAPVFARSGYSADGEFVMAGQWFPKLAAYNYSKTNKGVDEGWNLHQYHGNSEYYADFGIYNVMINVPEQFVVAATGFQTKPMTKRNGTATYHYYADDVHDFAWAASPHFVYAEEPFSSAKVPGVRIKLYLDPKHAELKDRYMQVAKQSLARFSEWIGEYPYSTLSIIVPPQDAEGAAGMEYPSFIAAEHAIDDNPGLDLERVVAHEIAHQYWYGIVASNEMEEPWLDESFASFIETRFMETEYDIRPQYPLMAAYVTKPMPLNMTAWDYGNQDKYVQNVYVRGKLVLTAIEQQIGQARMDRVLQTYYNRWKFKHPTTIDFQKTLEDVTKKSWSNYFKQFVYANGMVDYEIRSVKSSPFRSKDGRNLYDNQINIVRHGANVGAVELLIGYADGETSTARWDGQKQEAVLSFTSEQPVQFVAIDPNNSIVLENVHLNNVYNANISGKWEVRITLLTEKIIEALFHRFLW